MQEGKKVTKGEGRDGEERKVKEGRKVGRKVGRLEERKEGRKEGRKVKKRR